MATKASGKFSDDELLGGADDDEVIGGEPNLDDLDDAGAEFHAESNDGNDQNAGADTTDANPGDIEFVISDDTDVETQTQDVEAGADNATVEALNTDQEDLDDDDQDPGLLTEAEKKNYSVAVQKRIMRERRLRRTEQERADLEASRADSAMAQLRKAEQVTIDLMERVLANDIAAKTAELKAAKESADTDKEIALARELNDLQAREREVKSAKERLAAAQTANADSGGGSGPNLVAQRWIARNQWFNDPARFGTEIEMTRGIDRALAAEFKAGKFAHAPNTTEYLAEMDRRIKRNIPSLRTKIQQTPGRTGQTQQNGRPRTTVASVSRTATPSRQVANAAGKRTVVITKDDKENMIRFGLDPNNKAHLTEYARQKMVPAN